MSDVVQSILREISTILEIPVQIILIIFIAAAVFFTGWVLVEYFTERRHMKISLTQLLDEIRSGEGEPADIIENSGLLVRQKAVLTELTKHADMNDDLRESLAASLLEKESDHYDSLVKFTDTVSKLAPMFGLLGTLIPLGPGIIALGQGNTYALSTSLLTAFDTTVAGLIVAAICLVISTVRKRWYNEYMSDLETLADCVLEVTGKAGAETEVSRLDTIIELLTEIAAGAGEGQDC